MFQFNRQESAADILKENRSDKEDKDNDLSASSICEHHKDDSHKDDFVTDDKHSATEEPMYVRVIFTFLHLLFYLNYSTSPYLLMDQ